MKRITGVLCGLLAAMVCSAQSQIVVVTANGVRTEYAITDFGKMDPAFGAGDTTLTVYARGGAVMQSQARMVSFVVLPPEEFEEEDVVIEATSSAASFHWPKVEGANTYQLVIFEDQSREDIMMTLTFNRDGRLMNKDLTGLRVGPESFHYTIDGLEAFTTYYYAIAAVDAVGLELNVEQGTFNTLPTTVSDALEEYVPVQVYTRNRTLVVDAPAESDVLFFDTVGRTMGNTLRTTHAECSVQLPGVYMVRVNRRSYKLLVW